MRWFRKTVQLNETTSPVRPNLEELELTDEELEMINGGIFPAIIAGIALGAALKKINNKYHLI